MANTFRHRHGNVDPVSIPVDSTHVIEIGDLCWLDTDSARAASDFTWDTDAATTRESFADVFLGVALQASASGDTDPIRIGRRGVYVFNCDSDTYVPGALVGPDDDGDDLLEDQKVTDALIAGAIGRAFKNNGTVTELLVEIQSTVYYGPLTVTA